MKLRTRCLLAVSFAALLAGACSVGPEEDAATEYDSALVSADGAVTATISYNDWGAGYSGTVTVTNNGNAPTTTWTVVVNPHGSTISQSWNANSKVSGTQVTFTPLSWNAAIAPHQSVSFGFNAGPGGVSNEAQLVSVTQSGSSGGSTTAGSTSASTTSATSTSATTGGATTSGGSTTSATSGAGGATSGCSAATIEAEAITHSTGGAQDSGWNIWSNGSISTSVNFGGGSTTLTVIAKGTSASGIWPNMVVKVNGNQVGSTTVNTASYANYPFTFTPAAGTQTVSIEFTNDATVGTEDRNLIVDKFTVSCVGSGGTTTSTTSGAGGATSGGTTSATTSSSTGSGGGATSCTVPPALGVGQQSLTWYFFGQGSFQPSPGVYQTACGYVGTESGTSDPVNNVAAPNNYFVAIPGASSSNFTNSNYCGACVQITNTNNGKSVTATVIDECPVDSNPLCASAGHLDVSKTAFDALGFSVGNPSSGVSWQVVPCNVSGNVKVRVKSGNANQVYIENERLPIKSVTMNGAQATRLSYGAWALPGNAAGATLTLTDSSNRTITVAVSGSTSDQDTGKQFPACL